MVPRLSISSWRSMPMPLSATVSVLAFLLGRDPDLRRLAVRDQAGIGDRLIAQLVAGIGRVRDQLAQENIGLRINRMHHQLQQFGDLGLERLGFGGCIGGGH